MTGTREVVATFSAIHTEPPPPPPPPPPSNETPPSSGPSEAEILQQKRQKALKKCKKLKGKARAKCVKRAKAIGKRGGR
jgi:hypothetical protein